MILNRVEEERMRMSRKAVHPFCILRTRKNSSVALYRFRPIFMVLYKKSYSKGAIR